MDDTSGREDSEKTVDDCPTSAHLPSQVVLLRELENDDDTCEVSAVAPSRRTRISRGPASAPRAMRYACVLAPRERGAQSPLAHAASGGRKSEGPGSLSSVAGAERKRRCVDAEE